MRITRLKLVNFIGIKNGLGKDEIEIFFPKNKNIITTLIGKNGSGKSTIMSMLSPYKDSFDDRKTLVLPNKEGIKEIDYEHDGHEYKIKHIYGTKSASFLSEDGAELNENGGVRTFEDLIRTKFRLTKDYFKIGKIGSNTENFIQFTTTQRKTYISSFVEAVQKYLDAFKIVADKAKLNEQQIKQISSDLKKLDDTETLTHKLEAKESELQNIETTISTITTNLGQIEEKLASLNKQLGGVNYVELKTTLNMKENLLKKNSYINEKFAKQYAKIVTLDDCEKEITNIKEELQKHIDNKVELDKEHLAEATKSIEAQNNITKISSQLQGKAAIDLDKLLKEIENISNKIDETTKHINSSKLGLSLLNSKVNALSYLDSFKNFMITIVSQYSVLNDKTINPTTRNVELFFKPDFTQTFNEYAKTIRETTQSNRETLEEKNKEYSTKCANLDKLDILSKRPSNCTIDNCPFIADALKYQNLPEELQELDHIISGLSNAISDNEKQAEKLTDIKVVYSEVAKAWKQLNPRDNIIYSYFVSKYGSIQTFTKLAKNDLERNYQNVLDEAEELFNTIQLLEDNQTNQKIKESQYNQSVESEKNRLYFENELVTFKKQQSDCDGKKIVLASQITKEEKVIEDLQSKLKDFEDYKLSLTENDTLTAEVETLRQEIISYEQAAKEKTEKTNLKADLNTKIIQANNDKKNITTNITSLKATEINIQNLNKNMKELESVYKDTDIVRQALNPKSGIPLVFIQSYLDGTEVIANELLNIAYNGKFQIKFIPTANDFFIQVCSNGNVIEDIKLASQGEISMTTISISLALIERALGEYNIVYLDELDGPLDVDNRESFINILNKQIEKLGLEQIFVISHNNAFESCAMNLVLLPGAKIERDNDLYMMNKEIIFDATKGE